MPPVLLFFNALPSSPHPQVAHTLNITLESFYRIQFGDEIVSVNGVPVRNIDEAMNAIRISNNNRVTIKVRRREQDDSGAHGTFHNEIREYVRKKQEAEAKEAREKARLRAIMQQKRREQESARIKEEMKIRLVQEKLEKARREKAEIALHALIQACPRLHQVMCHIRVLRGFRLLPHVSAHRCVDWLSKA